MTDQCKFCAFRGAIDQCLSVPCGHRENWVVIEFQNEIDRLRAENLALKRLSGEIWFDGFHNGSDHQISIFSDGLCRPFVDDFSLSKSKAKFDQITGGDS